MKSITVQIEVQGLVQGVYYRKSTCAKAREVGLNGWVKNQSDGSVLLLAQGSPSAVEELAEWCWQGPASARVTSVQLSEVESQNLSGFVIEY